MYEMIFKMLEANINKIKFTVLEIINMKHISIYIILYIIALNNINKMKKRIRVYLNK